MSDLPKVSVVIPTLNEEKHLPRLLSDLEKQTLVPWEIVVIDGGSGDGTYKLAKHHHLTRVYDAPKGVGRQRRLGGYLAGGDYIFFLDADVRPAPDFLAKVTRQMEKRKLGVACPWYIPDPGSWSLHIVYGAFIFLFFSLQKIFPSGAGSCIVVKREVYENSRGFDHHFKFDDIEFIRRLARKNSFGVVAKGIKVSDRRFRQHGILKMSFLYGVMSIFFMLGWFWPTNFIKYEFGRYNKQVG